MVEIGAAVEPPVEPPLKHEADGNDRGNGGGYRERENNARPVHQRGHYVAARHGKVLRGRGYPADPINPIVTDSPTEIR